MNIMNSKTLVFCFFRHVYIRDFNNSIFLFNTIDNSKYIVNNIEVKSIIKKGIDEYNSAFSITENQVDFFNTLESLNFGIIKQSELSLYNPFTSKFKIENSLDIIKEEMSLFSTINCVPI